ncbi:MAG TPA: HupE/UreJ family protein [Vicinamibacterales bacterium]|jgi:hydrogenase/urease accessory protein HupE
MTVQRLILVACLVILASPAGAHPAPFSYLDLHLDASRLHGTLVIHDFDAAHELGIEKPAMLLDPEVAVRYRDRLVAIMQTRLRLSGDGRSLSPTWGVIDVLPDRQSVRLPLDFGAVTPGGITIDTVMFPYDPNHQTFINIYEKGQLRHQAVLDARNGKLDYFAGTTQGRLAVIRTFVASGIHHILIGPDHVLFLFGLLLLGGSLTRLAGIVTAFTIGHSITLSLAALDIVTPSTSLVEPAIALSIVIVGVDNLLVSSQKKPRAHPEATEEVPVVAEKPPRDLRAWLAAVFGLIHGFGFASVLKEFGLPRAALGWSLFSFNLGVEIGQLAIVIAFASILALVRKRNAPLGERLAWAGSIVVVLAGGYWFVERVWFTGV